MRTIALLAVAALVLTTGCRRSSRDINSPVMRDTPKMRDVSAREFELYYDSPRTPLSQWRYRGMVDGYFILDYYGRGMSEEAEYYYYSIRVRTYNMPKGFPDRTQPAVKTTLSKEDEQYLDNIGHEILLDNQRRGDTGITW